MAVEQKRRLQQVVIPRGGLTLRRKYRTNVTCLIFSGMERLAVKNECLVAQTVPVGTKSFHSLQKMDLLRREGLFGAA
jgi:hypothetical protein